MDIYYRSNSFSKKLAIFSLSLFIGIRFNRSKHNKSVISLISAISIIGIIIGVAVLIISSSAMNGFERELNNHIFSAVPHGEIEIIYETWNDWSKDLEKITKIKGIISATPYIRFTGIIQSKANFRFIQIQGVNLKKELIFNTLTKFTQKDFLENFNSDKKKIIIGKGIADTLKVKKGDRVYVMFLDNVSNKKLQQPRKIYLYISDILQMHGQLDHSFAIIPFKDAQTYLKMDNSITGIAIKVDNIFNANRLVHEAGKVINHHVHIKSWIDTYSYMYKDIKMVRFIIHLTMVLVIIVACFNITSTLMMAIRNKSGNISILRTLGAKDNFVRTIFIWYGLLISLTGSFWGVVIGIIISIRLTSIVSRIEKLINYRFLSSNVYFIDFLPSELNSEDIVYIIGMTILLSLLASWYPAFHASRVDPAKTLSSR